MRITLFILGSLFSVCTSANIYKCTDVTGKTDYQSIPCSSEHKSMQINLKTGRTVEEPNQVNQSEALGQEQQVEKLEEEQKKQSLLKQAALIESAKNQFLIKNDPKHYSTFSIPPYDPNHLPELINDYPNRLPDIERLRRLAAEKSISTGQCIRVEDSELHSKSTQKSLVFLVNCSSGKSFYFTEQELAA
jgi:hypothetical protein